MLEVKSRFGEPTEDVVGSPVSETVILDTATTLPTLEVEDTPVGVKTIGP